ncbi:MAG: phasin family protein [Gammaproteobacteria bacterium]
MNNPMQEFVRPLVDTSVRMVTNTLSGSRDLAVNGAQLVAKGRKPLHLVTESGLRLNTISHKSVARLMNVQAEMIEGTLVGTAKRLETAANANSVRELVNEQVALIPATRERLADDARKMLTVITDTGEDIKELVTGTVEDLSDSGENVVEAAAKTTRRATKKATKKASNVAKRATAKTRKTASKAKATAVRTKKKVARKVSKASK